MVQANTPDNERLEIHLKSFDSQAPAHRSRFEPYTVANNPSRVSPAQSDAHRYQRE